MKTNNIRLVQLKSQQMGRRIALVAEPDLILINKFPSVYDLASHGIEAGKPLATLIEENLSADKIDYTTVYDGKSEWSLLPSFDHPDSPLFCLVSGTGLTHKNSALNRQMMHRSAGDKPTDSMQMYQWGIEGGTPAEGVIGVQPEWFYKGNGSVLRAHGDTLEIPSYANDGGEEPELAGIYLNDKQGVTHRIGFSTGNEFSDHVMEKKNYLYLAPSKLRTCAIGPELVLDAVFKDIRGKVSIRRDDQIIWEADINTGEDHMAHHLANLEYHHFKYASHRLPQQVHIHFFGADAFSFGNQLSLIEGDIMNIFWHGMGRALQNPLKISDEEEKMIEIKSV